MNIYSTKNSELTLMKKCHVDKQLRPLMNLGVMGCGAPVTSKMVVVPAVFLNSRKLV